MIVPTFQRGKTLVAIIAVAVLAAIVIGVEIYRSTNREERTADATVVAYFEALADGDSNRALTFGDRPYDETFLTDDVLSKQLAVAPITDISAEVKQESDRRAEVDVGYMLGDRRVYTTVQLDQHDSGWRLVSVSARFRSPESVRRPLRVFGTDISDWGAMEFFPGVIPFEAADSEREYVIPRLIPHGFKAEYGVRGQLVIPGPSSDYLPDSAEVNYDLSARGEGAVNAAVQAYADACAITWTEKCDPVAARQQSLGKATAHLYAGDVSYRTAVVPVSFDAPGTNDVSLSIDLTSDPLVVDYAVKK